MSASPPNVAPLEYEQRKPFYRRRVPRQVFLLVVGALLLSLIWHYTPSLKELSIASWHRRCAAYSAAAGQVIYDDDPATYQKLPAGVNSSRALRQDRPYALLENPD